MNPTPALKKQYRCWTCLDIFEEQYRLKPASQMRPLDSVLTLARSIKVSRPTRVSM